jgi:hypothetical protein
MPGSSEAELQSELQVPGVKGTTRLPELGIVQVVSVGWACSSTELKICMVEDIESFRPELQLESV